MPFVYQEPGNKSKGIRFKEEIPLTGVFQEVIKGITKDGKMERLTSWANQRHNPVVIEFGKERAFINNKKKVVMSEKGDPLWATKLKGKRKEEVNIIEKAEFKSKEWGELIAKAKSIIKEREHRNWIWRKIETN